MGGLGAAATIGDPDAVSRFAVNLGYHTFLTFVAYYTAKAGVIAFTRSAAHEYGHLIGLRSPWRHIDRPHAPSR